MRHRRVVLLLLAVTALGAFFRLHRLTEVPPGLFLDEGINGLDAHAIASGGRWSVLIGSGVGLFTGVREPLFVYSMAAWFAALGPTVTALRLTPAIFGIVTVAGYFVLCLRLFGLRVALFAATLLAVGRWHVTFSRLGMRAILVSLWIVLLLLALERASRRRDGVSAVLAGAVFGLGFYTYPAYWSVPLALAAPLTALAGREIGRRAGREAALSALLSQARRLSREALDARTRLGRGLRAAAVAGVIVLLPLVAVLVSHPGLLFSRAARTFSGAETLDAAQRVLFMLHLRGDQAAQHNIPGRPLLDPLTGLLFLLGLLWLLASRRPATWQRVGVLAFWLVPLLPSVVTDSAPHAARAIGAAPAAYLIAGLGLAALHRCLPRARGWRGWRLAVPLALLLVAGGWNYHDFFRVWAADPSVATMFNPDTQRFVAWLSKESRGATVHATPYVSRLPPVRFLVLANGPELIALSPASFVADGSGRDRLLVSDHAEVNILVERVFPGIEPIGRFSVQGESQGRVFRLTRDRLPQRLATAWELPIRAALADAEADFARHFADW